MLSDYIGVDGGTNPLKSDYVWHNLQSTVTMATALIGALVGSFLWKRGERLKQRSRETSGDDVTPKRE